MALRVYQAKPRRETNWCTEATICLDEDGDFLLLFGFNGVPTSGAWHKTLGEAQSEAHESLGIEPSDWMEVSSDATGMDEVLDSINCAMDSAASNIDSEAIKEATIATKEEKDADESFAIAPPDQVDVGSLTEIHVRVYDIFSDHFQFYLWDIGIDPGAPTDYDEADGIHLVKVAHHCVVILPVRNTTVSVQIEVHPQAPKDDLATWDQVVDCSLDLPTGRLQVCMCTDGEVADWLVPAGVYRVRVYFGNLGSATDDQSEGSDHYCVALWPGDEIPLAVVKQWYQPT